LQACRGKLYRIGSFGSGYPAYTQPILAPRVGGTGEGDGYILNLAYDQTTALNDLLIFDAADIESGPVAKVRLPVRIPSGFHGTWVGA
jgi:carotenoid cleavage dioxygenase-like enzyme